MADDKKTAFVAGASGFTGREVVRYLAEKGVRAVAHVRSDSSRLEEWKSRFEKMGAEVDATPWEDGPLAETLAKLRPDYVFALLGTTRARMNQARKMGCDPAECSYEAVDYGLTSKLLKASKAAGSSPRFVYLSAAGVTEKSKSAYYKARARAEREIRESGLSYIIARPSFIVGPDRDDDRPFEMLGAKIMDALIRTTSLALGKELMHKYSSTSNVILAERLAELALDPKIEDGVYESLWLRRAGKGGE